MHASTTIQNWRSDFFYSPEQYVSSLLTHWTLGYPACYQVGCTCGKTKKMHMAPAKYIGKKNAYGTCWIHGKKKKDMHMAPTWLGGSWTRLSSRAHMPPWTTMFKQINQIICDTSSMSSYIYGICILTFMTWQRLSQYTIRLALRHFL